MSERYYFAYGSNMNESQMAWRCCSAQKVSSATIRGWKFHINSRGVATVIPEEEGIVYGILWVLAEEDEQALDTYEGVQSGFYYKKEFEVQTDDGRSCAALVYVASDSQRGVPRDGYMAGIVEAAIENGFPSWYVEELQEWCAPDA